MTDTVIKARLLEKYRRDVLPKLREEFSIKNVTQVPKILKVVVNIGIKEGPLDVKILEQAIEETFRGPFREWSCHECGIIVYGPKKWLHFHLGYHGKFQKREGRGNEQYQMKFGLY